MSDDAGLRERAYQILLHHRYLRLSTCSCGTLTEPHFEHLARLIARAGPAAPPGPVPAPADDDGLRAQGYNVEAVHHIANLIRERDAARAEADTLRAAVERVRADTLCEAMQIVHRATPAADTPLTFDGARTRIRGLIEAEYNRALDGADPKDGER